MKKSIKITGIVIVLLLGLDLVWFFATRSYLNSEAFFKKINNAELQFDAKDGYSPWPGYFFFKNFVFTGFAKEATYQVKAETVSFRFNFMQLARNHVQINGLEASDVTISVGDGRDSKSKDSEAKKAEEKKAAKEQAKEGDDKEKDVWITAFNNAKFTNLKEVKVATWLWTGHADLAASFETDSRGTFTLEASEADAKDLAVIHGDRKFATIEQANIVSSIEKINLNEKDWKLILPKVASRWKLKGKLDRIESLNSYMNDLDWLAFEGTSLDVDGDIGIVKGSWRDDSHLLFNADNLHIKLLHQTIFGPASFKWQVQDKNQVELKFAKFELNKGRDGSGEGFLLSLSTPDKKILNDWKVWDAHAVLPETKIHRVGFIQEYIPASLPLKLEKGEGTLVGEFRAGSDVARSKGDFRLKVKDLTAVYKDKLRFVASSDSKLKVDHMDLRKGQLIVKDAGIDITDLSFLDKKDWKGSLHLTDARVKYEKPVYLRSHVQLQGDNLQPVLAFLIKDQSFPEWILKAFDLKKPTVVFDVSATEDTLSVRDFDAKAGDLAIEGWMDQKHKVARARFLLNLGGFTGAYGLDGDKTQWKIINAKAWYTEEGRTKL